MCQSCADLYPILSWNLKNKSKKIDTIFLMLKLWLLSWLIWEFVTILLLVSDGDNGGDDGGDDENNYFLIENGWRKSY